MLEKPESKLPLQPNPFGSSALGTPWALELADVPAINRASFQLIAAALQQLRAGAGTTSIVLTGEPGSGKTHLLGRVRGRLQQDEQEGKGKAIYVYLRCNASAGTLWRHLRHALAADLLRTARKTGPGPGGPPEDRQSSSPDWQHASEPFALPNNTRKTGPGSGGPPEDRQSSSPDWQHASEPFALSTAEGTSQLQAMLASHPNRLEMVSHQGLRRVLGLMRDGRHFLAASAWLRGESLGPGDLALLDFAADTEQEDDDREWEAQRVVDALLTFLTAVPVVLCFDQVEALETYRGDEAGFQALGRMISHLSDTHTQLLLISCIVSAFEMKFDRLPNQADKDRWLKHKGTVKGITWVEAEELIKVRLSSAPALQTGRLAHGRDPLWPLDPEPLQKLFDNTGECLPRKLIRQCEEQFNALLSDKEPEPGISREEFLQRDYNRHLTEARKIVAKQNLSKTLSDTLPWLLQNSKLLPLGHDQARERYANQAWRGSTGDVALAFCDERGVALTNHLRRIKQNWTEKGPRLLIFRNPAIEPGPKGADYLADLKARGAQLIDPLPEALAALQAIRTLRDTARSGELFNGDQLIPEAPVSDWALAHLAPPANQLRNAIVGPPAAPDDGLLPRLAALLNERKIVDAGDAASRLGVSSAEVQECASRHPMRFGLLAGPPPVVFEGTQGGTG